LTDKKAYDGFLTVSDGKLAEGVDIKLYPLPPELQLLVKDVHRKASQEMSRQQ